MTLYSTAARRAELCQLKVQDIDSQRMMIRINQGKGGFPPIPTAFNGPFETGRKMR